MAIITTIPGLSVDVRVLGVALQEYSPPSDSVVEDNEVTAFVEAQPGASFDVRIEVTSEYEHGGYDLTAQVEVDGKVIRRPLLRKEQFDPAIADVVNGTLYEDQSTVLRSRAVKVWKKKPLIFSSLITYHGQVIGNGGDATHQIDNIGRITVKFLRSTIGEEVNAARHFGLANTIEDISPLPQSALQGREVSVLTRLGAADQCQKPTMYRTTKLDRLDAPMAKFTFEYRSLEDLKTAGIRSRTASPELEEQYFVMGVEEYFEQMAPGNPIEEYEATVGALTAEEEARRDRIIRDLQFNQRRQQGFQNLQLGWHGRYHNEYSDTEDEEEEEEEEQPAQRRIQY
ncbi:hypothetical protein EJ08DRAFT_678984 [Tothia fuscella]|uniref:DUF7918 domain-containing protein n=1 Tax=Tothia fuscella TaxID=1048955 RepID=A0A9P4NT05_9PEZI|nr:hypothetical protein EJ08DRAFT_678984 [Tothia fuscella]